MRKHSSIKESRPIKCANCGGTYGTLVKKGDEYVHQRSSDCEAYRKIQQRKDAILKQAKPVEKETEDANLQQETL